ncbi:MAG: RNA polymerase factor sigma-54 [Bacteroidota bacterium]|nr:RNA polymerase factor sigma-54 [Bacteroidota bacterium]
MLNQKLQQKLLQKLSPQQIQMIKLLEVPTIMLEQRIKKELEENPTLEEGAETDPDEQEEEEVADEETDDEFSLEDYIDDEDVPSYKLAANNYSKDDKKEDIPFSTGSTFHEHLLSQLGLQVLNEHQEQIVSYMIGNIDEDGYLRRDLDAIVDDLAFSQNINTTYEELRNMLDIIHDFEPVGVGARDLQECLLLQIDNKDKSIVEIETACKILKNHFEEFTRKHYDKIIKRLEIDEELLKDAIAEILKLNPKPGSSYTDTQNKDFQHIVPDFLFEYNDGEYQLRLNQRNVPELRLNRTYAEMLRGLALNRKNQSRKDKETFTFVKQKIDSAKWFIDAIKQRHATLLGTMTEILDYQEEYFKDGDETKLRPMILKDIAERTGLDISTISRVANSKYIQTHFGIFPLKSFFSEGMVNELGEEVSTREIKKILRDCIGNESKKKPLTDDKLTVVLKEKGYNIARRTVAKYREQLGLPVARMRKEL